MSSPVEAHWYCAKRSDDDVVSYQNPDTVEPGDGITVEDKQRIIAESEERRQIAHALFMIYGFTVEESEEWRAKHRKRTDELLKTCNVCVRNYHIDRRLFLRDMGSYVNISFSSWNEA
jgi:senataxin